MGTNKEYKCFKKYDHWASCNKTCNTHYKWEGGKWQDKGVHVWDCDDLTKPEAVPKPESTGEAEEQKCSDTGKDCRATKCCTNKEYKCFKKYDHWASCNKTCNTHYKWEGGMWQDKGVHVWDCDDLTKPAAVPKEAVPK